MEIFDAHPESPDLSPKADIISISPLVSEQLPLPTVSSLYLEIERWTLPLSESGIFLKPLISNTSAPVVTGDAAAGEKGNTKSVEDVAKSTQVAATKKAALKRLNLPSQAVELIPDRMPFCGAKKNVTLRIGGVIHTLLLSASGTDKGSWSTLVGFDEKSKVPRLAPFNENSYMGMLYEHFGS